MVDLERMKGPVSIARARRNFSKFNHKPESCHAREGNDDVGITGCQTGNVLKGRLWNIVINRFIFMTALPGFARHTQTCPTSARKLESSLAIWAHAACALNLQWGGLWVPERLFRLWMPSLHQSIGHESWHIVLEGKYRRPQYRYPKSVVPLSFGHWPVE